MPLRIRLLAIGQLIILMRMTHSQTRSIIRAAMLTAG